MARELALVVRPFDDDYDTLWSVLGATLVKTPTASFASGEHRLSETHLRAMTQEAMTVEIDIDLQLVTELCSALNLVLEDLRLSVRTYSKYTNLSDVIFSETLDSLKSGQFTIPLSSQSREDIDPLFACFTGFQVQTVLTLNRDQSSMSQSLAPRYRHSILGEARFVFLSKESEGNGLEIFRLNDELRKAEKIPQQTAVFIKQIESPISSNRLTDVLAVFVDSRIIERVTLRKSSSASRLHVAQIGIAILSDIVNRSSIELNRRVAEGGSATTLESLRKTVTGKLIEMLFKKGQSLGHRIEQEKLLEELIDNPGRTLARVQAIYTYQTHALESLELEEELV